MKRHHISIYSPTPLGAGVANDRIDIRFDRSEPGQTYDCRVVLSSIYHTIDPSMAEMSGPYIMPVTSKVPRRFQDASHIAGIGWELYPPNPVPELDYEDRLGAKLREWSDKRDDALGWFRLLQLLLTYSEHIETVEVNPSDFIVSESELASALAKAVEAMGELGTRSIPILPPIGRGVRIVGHGPVTKWPEDPL